MYATVADLREEGVTDAQASDTRLAHLIEEASAFIDHETGWWFEPRVVEMTLSGRGTPTVEPSVPPIHLASLHVDGEPARVGADALVVVGAPVVTTPLEPSITRRWGVFPRGRGNIVLGGTFGYTEPDGTAEGRTPLAIRRATMQLVLRLLPRITDTASVIETRDRWRVVEERTRDQMVRYAPIPTETLRTSAAEPEVLETLRRYSRPMSLGAA